MLIRTRLAIGVGLIVAFVGALIVLSLFVMRRSHERAAATYSLSSARAVQANMIREAAHDLDNGILAALLAGDDVARSLSVVRIRTAMASATTGADDLQSMALGAGPSRFLAEARGSIAQVQDTAEEVIRGLGSRTEEAQATYRSQLRPAMDRLRQSCAMLVAQQDEQRLADYAALGRFQTRLWWLLVVTGGLVISIVVAIGVFFHRSITRPLRQAVHMADQLADGQPVDRLDIRGGDEMAQLLKAMNLMAMRIRQNQSLEQQLQQSQKLETVGRLAGGIAHDFNNLLTVIITYADFLVEEEWSDREATLESVDEIKKATVRAIDLTRQLLAFSRKQVMELKVLQIESLLRDSEKMLRRLIGEDIELRTRCASTARICADPGQLHQVIMNLAVNARDAMPHGGILTIETADWDLDAQDASAHPGVSPGRYVALLVRDTGIGMTREVQAKMFEPFFTTKEPGRGTGLGLSTVYGIVKQSGGHITVQSEPGEGTTFSIILPSVDEEPTVDGLVRAKPESSRGNEEVLLVEDEDQVRQLATRVLQQRGYTVRGNRRGREAIELLRTSDANPAILLTDVVMPEMNGFQVAEQVTSLRPGIRVLFMSGYTDHAVVDRRALCDANFIGKPFTAEDLARKVRQVLDVGPDARAHTVKEQEAWQHTNP